LTITIFTWKQTTAIARKETNKPKGKARKSLRKHNNTHTYLFIANSKPITIMGNIMGKEKPLKEVLRENKRMINRAIRELDREKIGLEREEKRLTMEIKKSGKRKSNEVC